MTNYQRHGKPGQCAPRSESSTLATQVSEPRAKTKTVVVRAPGQRTIWMARLYSHGLARAVTEWHHGKIAVCMNP